MNTLKIFPSSILIDTLHQVHLSFLTPELKLFSTLMLQVCNSAVMRAKWLDDKPIYPSYGNSWIPLVR